MKVIFERSGGFAGIVLVTTVDTETLSPDEGNHLRQLMQATNFFSLPTTIVPISSQPDRFHYKIAAEDGIHHHTVQFSESVVSDQLRLLVDWLTEISRSR